MNRCNLIDKIKCLGDDEDYCSVCGKAYNQGKIDGINEKCQNTVVYDKEKMYCPKFCDVIEHTLEDARADERRKLLIWLTEKEYLCQVFIDEDEDFDGNRTYETVTQYLDVDEVLEEYEGQKNE